MRWILIFLPLFLAAMPPLNEVLNYPKSYYRDFWLIQYLKKTDDGYKAEDIYNEITYKKDFHLKLLAKKNSLYKTIYDCKHITQKNWIDYPPSCIIENGFSFWSLKHMSKDEIKTLLVYIPNSKIKKEIKIVSEKDYKKSFNNLDIFYDIFLKITPNIEIPKIYINNITKDRRFKYLLPIVVRNPKKDNIQKSFLNIHYKDVKDSYKFELALNAIHYKRYNLAIKILKSKKHKTNQDIFWLYLLTQNKKYANKLLNNSRLDFYTLWIYEKFDKKYKIDKVKITNSSIPIYDINDPLDIIQFYQTKAKTKNLFNLAKKLDNNKTLPLKALVLDKAYNYTKNYYIMPKYDLDDFTISQKALFYGLARQESRFIPAQTSRSYAIGLMQMMPFLIRAFEPDEDIENFWSAKTNVKYAKKHLLWLLKKLDNNPLFVSYAYNGGIGFTKRKVIPYFKFKGEFEPFYSMEMVPYSESREYGKKVITNYVIYKTLLGEKTTLHQLFDKFKK